jgi:tetratricopeptide (TPR) repeat protein
MKLGPFIAIGVLLSGHPAGAAVGADGGVEATKIEAYQLYEQKQYEAAAARFKRYVEQNPDDFVAAFDYAAVLSQLKQHEEAARVLESVRQKNPGYETAHFRLGVEYVNLKRYAEAEQVFTGLEQSSNRELAEAAAEAHGRLREDTARAKRFEAERNVFDLAVQFKHEEVVAAANDLEKLRPLAFPVAMQRLYALQSLGQFALALDLADRLALEHPAATDLALLRAALLAQFGRRVEAVSIWRQIERDNAATAAAAEAARRLASVATLEAEERVFELARQERHREVVEAANELEQKGALSLTVERQRLYAWQALGQKDRALKRANELAANHPKDAELALLRADLLEQHDQWAEAAALLRQVARENPGTTAAFEAEKRLGAQSARREKNKAREYIFEQARQRNDRAVLSAIDELEKAEELDWTLQLQRLYALEGLGEYSAALAKADALAATHPRATDLALLRSELLSRNDQRDSAIQLLQELRRQYPDTPVAAEATRRLTEVSTPSATHRAEQHVFELAARQQHRDVIVAVDELERQGELPWMMQLQRLYALQALGETARGLELTGRLALTRPEAADLALMRADLLIRAERWQDAAEVLQDLKRTHGDEPVAREADRRLKVLPAVDDLDRWYWGEAYLSGDYLGRFGTLIGSGFVRHGTFIPGARWLQPFQEFRFSVDTRSKIGGQRSVIADNFVAASVGLRAQPFETEYLYFYVSGGLNKDLLDRRDNGDWAADFQVGVYGFKSWGPGTVLHTFAPEEMIPTTGNVPALSANAVPGEEPRASNRFLWRLAWFADAASDFSYYKRYANWIGYGQGHEGFRVFQVGPHLGFDMYAVQNISWDTRGNYFDNLVELGPGLRWLWAPRPGLEVVLRGEWLKGYYLGRDDGGRRAGAEGQYDDFRVGLSLGVRW